MTETDLHLMLGGRSRDELRSMLAAQGVKLNGYAEELLTHSSVDAHAPQAVVLTQRTVAELGLPRGGTLPQIFTAGEERGLLPCPLETGPYLRLTLSDQEQAPDSVLSAGRAPTGSLHVLSAPLSEDHEVPKGFYLRVVDGVGWLRGYRCDDEYVLPPESALALRRPTTEEL